MVTGKSGETWGRRGRSRPLMSLVSQEGTRNRARSFTPTRVQFGSRFFTQRAKESGLLASMGNIGECSDSMIEAF
jgi:hypothetical protein